MKKLLFIAMACYGLSASAQQQKSGDFLYLYSDSIVYAENVRFRPDFSGNLRIKVDSRNVPMADVKFLNSKDGFFANTRRIGFIRTKAFAERIIEGKINVFQERALSYAPFIHNAHPEEAHFVPAPATSINVNMYYNKGFDDLKRLNYSNLKRDLANHPQSMDLLKAYKKGKNTSKLLYVAGAAAIFGMGYTVLRDSETIYTTKGAAMSIGLGALGLGLIAGGYFKDIASNSRLEDAIDAYNR